MSRLTRIGGVGTLVACACLQVATSSVAAPKRITGNLSEPGYTVIALTGDGRATSALADDGSFRIPTVSGKVSLHLRGPDGTYAGPIVAGGGQRKAILGIEKGVGLGNVAVHGDHGEVAKRLPERDLDARRTAKARKGVPIGAGKLGLVRSRPPRNAPPDDPDADGIPDVFDVDDDGDLVTDLQDRRSSTRTALRGEPGTDPPDPEIFGVGVRLSLGLETTANANPRSAADPQEPAFSDPQIEAALPGSGALGLNILPGTHPELNCGGAIQDPPRPVGLVYCRPHSAGGIGMIPPVPGGPTQSCGPPVPQSQCSPFPDCCDTGFPGDPDGNGTMTPSGPPQSCQGCSPEGVMTLLHRASARDPSLDPADPATPEGIGTGDVLMQQVTRGGTEIGFINTLAYVFATVPALAAYDDGTGVRQIQYPIGGSGPPQSTALAVQDTGDPDSDIEVELSYWRLQRRAVPAWGETPGWMDVGRLAYEAQAGFAGARCPNEAFTIPDGGDLRADDPDDEQAPGFSDLQGDRPADPQNVFTFTLNLSECFRAAGVPFAPGDPPQAITFQATSFHGGDATAFAVAGQTVSFAPQ